MQFNISIEKKQVFVMLLGIFVISSVVAGVAFGGSNPAFHGHDNGEIIESDPTVPSNVKDGIAWTEVSGRPSTFSCSSGSSLKSIDLDSGVKTCENDDVGDDVNNELVFGAGYVMDLPSGSKYKVTIWSYYFTCEDLATTLRLDGNNIKTHTGDDNDSHGCDQNTIAASLVAVQPGSHTWSISRGSQHNFVWIAKRE